MALQKLSCYSLCLVLVVALTVVIGCSSKPSATDAQTIVTKLIQKQSNGLIKLVNLKKTNGQEGEMMGAKFYSFEYEAIIEFLNDCYWADKTFMAQKDNPGYWGSFMTKWFKAKKGQQATAQGKLLFEKTEKGWRCREDGQVY